MGILSRKKTEIKQPEEKKAGKESVKMEKRLTARRKSIAISSFRLMSKGAFTVATGLMLLMGITYAASSVMTSADAFVIRAEEADGNGRGVISLSETSGFSNPVVNLSVQAIDGMDNISYTWLPLEELDTHDGSYNGEDYIAYTFYLKNSGSRLLRYSRSLKITKSTRRVAEAARVMVYKNGEKTIYAQQSSDGRAEVYPEGVQSFCEENLIMQDSTSVLQPGGYDRYTVVVWLEGEDPECTDLIRGGTFRMEMVFNAVSGDGSGTENTVEL